MRQAAGSGRALVASATGRSWLGAGRAVAGLEGGEVERNAERRVQSAE
jgi:hypothetical protein